MSSGTFHESDLVQAVAQLRISKIFGYRDFLAYVSSFDLPIIRKDELGDMTFVNSGSYSTVYRTTQIANSKVVAFKTPKWSLSREEARIEDEVHHRALSSIIQELRILAHPSLAQHPNLPSMIGISFLEESSSGGLSPCILQEYAFSNLGQYLTCSKGIPMSEKLRMALDVASGICALHAYHLVHGDIHPKNVLLFAEADKIRAAVGDLGTCGVELAAEFIPGTREYWAPECHPKSPFHKDYGNTSKRDVYSFGLLVVAVLSGSYLDAPFPSDQQFDIQHNQTRTNEHLKWGQYLSFRSAANDTKDLDQVLGVVNKAIKVEPKNRPDIASISQQLQNISGEGRTLKDVKEFVTTQLLISPDDARVRTVNQMPLPAPVLSKFTSEYFVASMDTKDANVGLVVAALHSGIIGPGLAKPWNVVAKVQWLFKVLELGSYSVITSIVADHDTVRLLEKFGAKLLRISHSSFDSPNLDLTRMMAQLRLFASMPDDGALKILEWLGETVGDKSSTAPRIESGQEAKKSEIRKALPNLFQFERFTMHRNIGVGPIDSDASDLYILTNGTAIEQNAYNDSLESFIKASSENPLTRELTSLCMQQAVYGNAPKVSHYLVRNCGVSPNDEYQNMSHFDLSIVFNRPQIVNMFIANGGILRPATGNRLSGLHLASRFDDKNLIATLCQHLQREGTLSSILQSTCSTGDLAGWDPIYTAMASHSYINVIALLDFGADPNSEHDGDRLIHLAVQPACPAPPTSVLVRLIEAGADLDASSVQSQVPLHTAIGSSNVWAVYYLLLGGAGVNELSNAGETALEAAEDIVSSMEVEGDVVMLNEDGEVCEGGHAECVEASRRILDMVRVATRRFEGWTRELRGLAKGTKKSLLEKMWIVDKVPTDFYLKIDVPP